MDVDMKKSFAAEIVELDIPLVNRAHREERLWKEREREILYHVATSASGRELVQQERGEQVICDIIRSTG